LGQAFFPRPASAVSAELGVSVAAGDFSGVGVGDALLCFDLLFGVPVGDGVGETFFRFGEAVGDGVGVVFFVELFLCFRVGAGVGVAKIFLIVLPNDSSAALEIQTVVNGIAKIRSPPTIVLPNANLVRRFCETPIDMASDTDALQWTR